MRILSRASVQCKQILGASPIHPRTMYSNWLTSTASPVVPAAAIMPAPFYGVGTNLLPAPDVLLEIGSPPLATRYWAHSHIICPCSGYLRSAVATSLAHQRDFYNAPEKPITIPSVSVDQFQPLLRYMYSGFLDLTTDNIFGVLLATHVLHMPHALEICRAFLSRMQDQGLMPGEQAHEATAPSAHVKQTIVKPIPNKAQRVSTVEHAIVSTPSAPHVLVPSSHSTFQAVKELPEEEQQKDTSSINAGGAGNKGAVNEVSPQMAGSINCGKAVLDIASCDGPVRFRRVINKFYTGAATAGTTYRRTSTDVDTLAGIQQLRGSSFHQQMARDINARRMSEETSVSSNSQEGDQHSSTTTATFRCAVCKHSFKSEYCYLKHSRRHLNPVLGLDADNAENPDRITTTEILKRPGKLTKANAAPPKHSRDVIRPLDMNVQYYPCKTCGSKFPSYYFVHKHRKMCHAQTPDVADGDDPSPRADE